MTKDEAMDIVLEAAESWANELTEYIIPAEEDWRQDEEAEAHSDYADKIHEAIKILGRPDGC